MIVSYMQVSAQLAGDRIHVHYQVRDVQATDHEKIVFLEGTYSQEAVVLHLQDGWFETPVLAGHHLNLLAGKTRDTSGVVHAVCNFDEGTPMFVCMSSSPACRMDSRVWPCSHNVSQSRQCCTG